MHNLRNLLSATTKTCYFPLSSLREVGIRLCGFQAAAGDPENTRVDLICGPA